MDTSMARVGVELNGVRYRWPSRPIVVVCIDGGDPAYVAQGVRDGIVPNVARFMKAGFAAVADGDVPSFTCPNNMSIATGSPPAVHGISGNFYLDRDTGAAVVMTGPELLRSRTILAEFSRHRATVVSITAKDKLRKQLGKDMDLAGGSVNFSSECADQTTLLERSGPDLLYLSLTDYIQHKYAPGEPEADRYYRNLDACFGRLDALGAVVALTADHGMHDKSNPDGSPRVIWLQDVLDARFGKGACTVICPITDRFVAHHGALGGFVRVYCHGSLDPADVMKVAAPIPGVEAVCDRATTARRFDLPFDREGDVAVISTADTCIGASEKDHDLSGLRGHRLRTHGGISEARVPFILNRPLRAEYAARAAAGPLRSSQIFDFAINGVE